MYHEKKVHIKTATFLDAGFYLQDPQQLTLEQKLSRLSQRMLLNGRCKRNVVGLSLHFDHSDQLGTNDLKRIAAVFLKSLGFDKQPYLLYEHHDTLHKHVHVVSTLIRTDGSSIAIGHPKRNTLRKVQTAVETQFGLKSANAAGETALSNGPGNTLPTEKTSRLTAIKSAVQNVLDGYRFSSFTEYNALLKQFGVQASKGRKESQLFKFKGLVYRTIDARGRATCKAVKASSLHPGATLKALSQVFDLHAEELFKHRSRLTNTVDLALLDQAVSSLGILSSVLEKKGIKIHLLRAKKETDYHLIYIDNRTRCAYDADKLGDNYQLEGLYKRCVDTSVNVSMANMPLVAGQQYAGQSSAFERWPQDFDPFPQADSHYKTDALLADLLSPAFGNGPVPFELRKPAKKRKRKTTR